MEDHFGHISLQDRQRARIVEHIGDFSHSFGQGFFMPYSINGRQTHGHDNRHNGDNDHEFDESEPSPRKTNPNRFAWGYHPHTPMLEVMANIPESTLTSSNQNPIAIPTITTAPLFLFLRATA